MLARTAGKATISDFQFIGKYADVNLTLASSRVREPTDLPMQAITVKC